MILLTQFQREPRKNPAVMNLTPIPNPGDDIADNHNLRPRWTEEKRNFMDLIDKCLKQLGKECGNVKLCMGRLGFTNFTLNGQFTIAVEVPAGTSFLRVYTLLHRTQPDDSPKLQMKFMKKALELNYLQQKTFGAVLSLDPCPLKEKQLELTLSALVNMLALEPEEFVNFMLNFMQTTIEMYREIMIDTGLLVVDDDEEEEDEVEPPQEAPKRQVWIAYPRDHPRDIQMLDEEYYKMLEERDNEEEEESDDEVETTQLHRDEEPEALHEPVLSHYLDDDDDDDDLIELDTDEEEEFETIDETEPTKEMSPKTEKARPSSLPGFPSNHPRVLNKLYSERGSVSKRQEKTKGETKRQQLVPPKTGKVAQAMTAEHKTESIMDEMEKGGAQQRLASKMKEEKKQIVAPRGYEI